MEVAGTHQDEFVILSYTAKAVGATITSQVIKGDSRDERRVALTSGDDSLLPGRKDGDKVILTTCKDKSAIWRPSDASECAKIGSVAVD